VTEPSIAAATVASKANRGVPLDDDGSEGIGVDVVAGRGWLFLFVLPLGLSFFGLSAIVTCQG
jgi:hypothetical protein